MTKQAESRLQKRIRKELERQFGGWWMKTWGGPFTPAGVPDLIGCTKGVFFAFEVKLPNVKRSKTSKAQDLTLMRMVRAGGVACVVRSVKDAVYTVNYAMARATESPRLRYQSAMLRASTRAESWQDCNFVKADRASYREWLRAVHGTFDRAA